MRALDYLADMYDIIKTSDNGESKLHAAVSSDV